MNPAPQNISAMTDISANIFSLLILVLIIFLAARASPNSNFPTADAPPTINIEKEVAGIERSPLNSEELFDLLYERNELTGSIKVDLLGKTIDIVSNHQRERFDSIENATLRLRLLARTSNRAPIGIYVFDHRFYRDIAENLKALGWAWREVSVPEALREFDATKKQENWSAGFSALVAGPADRARFRVELARLLASSPTHDASKESGGNAAGAANQSPETIVQAFLRWVRAVVKAFFIGTGLTFVLWVELRHRRKSQPAM